MIKKALIIFVIALLFISYGIYNDFYKSGVEETGPDSNLMRLNQIRTAIYMYYLDTNGKYPKNIDVLVGKYLRNKPFNPWGMPYMLDTNELEVYSIDDKKHKKSIKYGIYR